MSNPFLVEISREDGPDISRLALLFLVRASMRIQGRGGRPTPRQIQLERAASAYPLPPLNGVERTKMLIAARTRGLVSSDLLTLTDGGYALLAPFDQGTA